jgi:hypothetical protein
MTPTPNWFAFFALLFWPVVTLWLYQTRPVGRATLWAILGAQLLLPVGAAIKFEGIPQFDKISIPNLAALVGCLLVLRRPLRIWNRFGLAEVLLLMYLVGPFVTSMLNRDVTVIGGTFLPAVGAYDALSAVVGQFIFLLPFFLGRQLLRSSVDNEEILRVLVIAGLFYSLLMLIEIRMSPQLHRWFYGYHGASFATEVREGGFRPTVFMQNGLMAASFAMTAAVAAAAFWRMQSRVARIPAAGVTAYMTTILVLCKSVGALLYGAVLVPLIRFTKPRLQIRVALVLATFALLYPMLRAADLVPTSSMVEAAALVSGERADSLKFRFDNEQQLLERASQRSLFGWGRFGRNRVYDPETGKDVSITDGRWIITMGQFGWFGFLAEFGLLVLPIFRAASALRFAENAHDNVFLVALALIVAISVVELIPNATVTPWTWLLAGALLGRAEALRHISQLKSTAYLPNLVIKAKG